MESGGTSYISGVDGISVAAHELKSPLCLMRQLALSMDLEEAPTADSLSQLQKTQRMLVDVSERALRQVNDLTKIARLDYSLFPMEPVAVRSICDDVYRELSELFCQNNRKVKVRYSNKSRLVVANHELLYSVIYNFCANAMHYSDAASTSILSVRDHAGKVRIDIRDYGPALPLKIWRKIQSGELDAPTDIAMRPGSSGLGLYIASKFSRYMHAEVGALRHRNGTSFFVELPVSRQLTLFSAC